VLALEIERWLQHVWERLGRLAEVSMMTWAMVFQER
jgi:hypothetical protein